MDHKEFFKISHPILAAAMNQVSDVKLAVACSKAGILPSLSVYTWAENYNIDYLVLENVMKDFQDQAGTENILLSAGIGDLLSYDFFNFVQKFNIKQVEILGNDKEYSSVEPEVFPLYKKNNIKVINLTYYSQRFFYSPNIIDESKELNLNYSYDKFERSGKFVDYINNFNIINLNEDENYKFIIENDFIVLHYRFTMVHHGNKIHNKTTENLFKILNKIREHTNNTIVIFCSKLPDDKVQKDLECKNIVVIDNLQYYASFLSNKKCKLLISEWSGGGQLSQYCFDGGKILYYFDFYPSNDYELKFNDYQKTANLPNNIFCCWDFKSTKTNEREYYKTLDLMISDLSKHFNE